MTIKKRIEFSRSVKEKVMDKSGNKCERCSIDFDDDFKGELHHIRPIFLGGKSNLENCSLLCKKCHNEAPNVRDEKDLLVYKYFFLRFASFKEETQYYNVNNRLELYGKIAKDIAEKKFNK